MINGPDKAMQDTELSKALRKIREAANMAHDVRQRMERKRSALFGPLPERPNEKAKIVEVPDAQIKALHFEVDALGGLMNDIMVLLSDIETI